MVCDNKGMKSVRFNLGDVIVGTGPPRSGLVRSKSTGNLLFRKVTLVSDYLSALDDRVCLKVQSPQAH